MPEIVASDLRQRIIRGELREGDNLPPESDLIKYFGVSRATFREAFCILESEGLISISRGVRTGAVVHRPSVAVAARYMNFILQADNVSIDDVYQSLAIFEPAVVRLLAETATRQDIRSLRRQLKATYDVIDDHHKYGQQSARFHELLIDASGLKSLALFMGMLSGVLASYVERAAQPSVQVPLQSRQRKLQIMALKDELIDAIERHDAAAAEDIWKRYFQRMHQFMSRWHPLPSVQDLYGPHGARQFERTDRELPSLGALKMRPRTSRPG
jgi:DNA-binding FadR family transcriptional regulator